MPNLWRHTHCVLQGWRFWAKGMRSIIGEIGTGEFPRIRIGIKDPEVNIPIINYVLAQIRQEDYPLFAKACEDAADAAIRFAKGESIENVMNAYNRG